MALFVPFVHLPAYAEEQGVGPVAAAGLIGAIGMASVAGRLALGALAGGSGLLRVFQGCYAAMGLSFGLWAVAGGSYAAMLAFAAVLGVGYGGFVALAPAVVAARFGVANLGALLGVLYTGPGIGSAVGPPLAGAVDRRRGLRPGDRGLAGRRAGLVRGGAAGAAAGLAAARGAGARARRSLLPIQSRAR